MNSAQLDTPRRFLHSFYLPVALCHFAFWFGVVFATPVFVAAHNLGDLVLSLNRIAGILAAACVLLAGLSYLLGSLAGSRVQRGLSRILLAMALLSAIQGNVVNDQFYYGAFNGEQALFRSYGWLFYAEWLTYLLLLALLLYLLLRLRKMPLWLPLLPLVSFLLLLLPLLVSPPAGSVEQDDSRDIDPSVFAFSSIGNLIHLLPDGLQGDVVRETLEKNPKLAARFEGFTLYTNHLGLYQSTAPALYTILTGEPFDLEKGHEATRVQNELANKSYQKALFDRGYQLDYVPIGSYVCPEYVSSCYPRPFNDMKARGYFRHHTDHVVYSLRLLADLSLFRLAPMFLKEKIHDDGHWFLADTTMDGSSPWPDPVLREWLERMTIVDDRPVYKWYHFIGGHIPPHWDADCGYLREARKDRESYTAQTYCILNEIAHLLERLKERGIYDQTAIIISSDHGHNIAPDDLVAPPLNGGLYPGMLGSGRPTLLVKRKNDRTALVFSTAPTSLIDVAPTALSLAGLASDQPDVSAFTAVERRERYFTPFSIPELWSGDPIPFVRYRVDGPVNDGSEWLLTGIQPFAPAPGAYARVNYNTAYGFMLGAVLNPKQADSEAAWISGRQLGFLLNLPASANPRALQLTLNLPGWIDHQDFTLSVNGMPSEQSHHVQRGKDYWQTIDVPLDSASLVAGNNLFSILFELTYRPPERADWSAAGLLQSIRVVEQTSGQIRP